MNYSASEGDTSKDTVNNSKEAATIRANTSYRQRLENELKTFKLEADIRIIYPDCADEDLISGIKDIPRKDFIRAYESEDEFDVSAIKLCQKKVSSVDDVNVLYGKEEKSDYFQITIDKNFSHDIYLKWKPINYEFSEDSQWEVKSDDENNDDHTEPDKCKDEGNDTTPSLSQDIDDSETETASENPMDHEDTPCTPEQNTDKKLYINN